MRLETKRLILRDFTEADIPAMTKILSDPVTMSFWPAPFDEAGARAWVERSIESYRTEGFGRLALILKESGELIGHCGFLRMEVNGRLENDLGYIVEKTHWKKGLAIEAASACLEHAFEVLGFDRVVANMEKRHLDSKRVAEKLGFQVESEFLNPKNRQLPTLLMVRRPERTKSP